MGEAASKAELRGTQLEPELLSGAQDVPERIPASRIRNELLLSFFAFLNLVLARRIATLEYFASVERELTMYCAIVSVLFGLSMLVYCSGSIVLSAIESLKKHEVNRDVLLSLALVLSTVPIVYGLIVDFDSLLRQSVYDSLVVIIFVLTIDKFIGYEFDRLRQRSTGFSLLRSLGQARKVIQGWARPGAASKEDIAIVNAESLSPGDILLVETGMRIPGDGVILEGSAEISEVKHSPRQSFRFKSIGQKVYGGSLVTKGSVKMQLEAPAEDSTICYFTQFLDQRIGRLRNQQAVPVSWRTTLNLLLIFASCCAGLFWYEEGKDLPALLSVMSAVLLVSIVPRFLDLASELAPLAISSLFHLGAFANDEKVLDRLAGIDGIVLDFQRSDEPQRSLVEEIEIVDDRIEREVLRSVVLCLLSGSEEVSELFDVSQLKNDMRSDSTLFEVRDYRYYPGRGVSATVEGAEFTVGSETFLIDRGVQLLASEVELEGEPGRDVIFVAVGEELVARIVISADAGADTRELLEASRRFGLRTILCSTESAECTDTEGKKRGIELASVFGDLDQKSYLRRIESIGSAAVVSDKKAAEWLDEAASVSVSKFDELLWSLEHADLIMFGGGLRRIPSFITLARVLRRVRMGNAILAIGLSLVLLALACSGLLAPGVVAFSALFGSLFLYLNSMRVFPGYMSR